MSLAPVFRDTSTILSSNQIGLAEQVANGMWRLLVREDKTGGLINGMFLCIELPVLTAPYAYVKPNLGYMLIDSMSLSVKGVELDRMSGVGMLVKSELSKQAAQADGVANMLDGVSVPEVLIERFECTLRDETAATHWLLHVPLPFWFARSTVSNPFPLGVLAREDAVLQITFRSIAEVIVPEPPENTTLTPKMSLVTSNLYIPPDVSNELLRSEIDLTKKQLFQQNFYQIETVDLELPIQRLEIICNRPVRRILWTVVGPMMPGSAIMTGAIAVSRLVFDGHDVAATAPKDPNTGLSTDAFYSEIVQPYLYGSSSGVPGVCSHSFALSTADRPYMGPKLPLYPFSAKDADYGSPYADQPSGAFDLSYTRNFLEVQLNPEVVPEGSSIHVLFETYNVLEYTLDEMKTLYID
ncbi:hypothetical protein KFL_007890040 [Klebsormidium nitens]|uniref:Major capsid protein N-terminal domain-containing protein n=1 Tax=Klebsormidium nitens TaxID=105231 RepID=A0A1Y1IRT5_KLENI|nr:hypothetical protein KFL_007890040 [Klebsormidium nitens]|eukprot:GAQ91456.1 hypothetical protein KFL_007890040 [Klebsormidium nitens]